MAEILKSPPRIKSSATLTTPSAHIWALPVIDAVKPVSIPVSTETDPTGLRISDSNGAGEARPIISTPPEPLPALPDVLAFDFSYMPDSLRGYVRDISERMQCPPDFAAVGVLVMMATIIGRKVGIRPMRHNDWTVIPNLWGAVVGNSGVMKSPTLAAALSPIKRLSAAAYEVFNKAKAEYDAQAELAKLEQSVNKSAARAKLKKDKTADVKNLLQSAGTDDAPILKRYITNNASYEALGELLMENPNGLLAEADEIIGLLKQLDANGHPINQAALHWLNKTDWGASEDSLHAITLMRWGIEELGTTADIWETPEDAFHSTEILARLNPHLAIKVLEMPQNPELADEETTLTGEALMEAEDQEVAALMLLENLAEAARPQAYSWSTLTDLSNQA